jgi:hypothetical protein
VAARVLIEGDAIMIEEKILWFTGIDWGSEKHQACVLDAKGNVTGERDVSHSGAGLAELCDWIVSIAGDVSTVAVAIEVPHGPSSMSCWIEAWPSIRSIPSSSTACAIGSVPPAPRMIGAMPVCALTVYVTTAICSVACRSRTPALSGCVTGRVWPKSCSRSECVLAIASVTSSGAITRRCSN